MSLKTSSAVLAVSAMAFMIGYQDGLAQTRSPAQRIQGPSRTHHLANPRRAGTRIIVTRRSYLDAGTEVMPGGDRKFTDYVFPPGYNPAYVGGFDPVGARFYPLSSPFFPRWP
jgi:hypothetical protein